MRKLKLFLVALTLVGGSNVVNAAEEDYTDRITNADLSSKDGWTLSTTGGKWSDVAGSSPSFVLEAYAGWGSLEMTAYSIKQNVTLPAGKYRAEGYAFYRYGLTYNVDPSISNARFVAGDFSSKVVSLGSETLDETLTAYPDNTNQASAAFTNGYYKSEVVFAIESESTIEFGYEGTHTLKQSWFIAGPIKLYRTGDFDYSLYQEQLDNLVSEANALLNNATYANVTGSERNNLQNAAQATVSEQTVAAYQAVISDITAAISKFESSLGAYNSFAAAKAELNENVANKLNVPVPSISSTTTAADLEELIGGVFIDEHTAAKAYKADYTSKLGAWTNAPGTNHGESWDGTSNDTYYDLYNSDDRAMTQSVVLPAGDYALIAKGRASANGLLTVTDGTETVTFAHKSSTGRGIATDGTPTYAADATYANNNAGRGWEYRVLTFTSDGETATTLTFNMKTSSSNWVGLDDIELRANPVEFDYTALQAAYNAVNVPTLGFGAGEYAPYVNAESLEKIETAKIWLENEDGTSQNAINELAVALGDLTWTANTEDVECVYNGNFAIGQGSAAADIQKYGWTRTNGWGQFQNGAEGDNTNGTVYYNQLGSLQYGNAGVYTMPLKANTVYELKFKYGKWDQDVIPTVSVLCEENGMAAMSFDETTVNYKTSMVSVDMVFVTGAAGNYVLTVAGNKNLVLTGVSIKKATSQTLEFADGTVPTYAPGTYPSVKISRSMAANRWYTAIYPFAVSGVNNISKLTGYDAESGNLSFESAEASEANKPFLMMSTAAKEAIELTDVEVVAAAATDVTAGNMTMKGVYSATEVAAADGVTSYVLSNNQLKKIASVAATVTPYRAYFQVQPASEVRGFTVDGEETAIEGITVTESENGSVYNLNGQRVNKAQKGLYIVNGKKVVVK